MLKSINIKKFRKFKELNNIYIGSRLTLISGSNGIGKSTLLGIIASGSGTKHFKNLHNKDFHPDFKKYFIINKNEFKRQNSPEEYQVILNYLYKNTSIYKRLKLSHPEGPKLVPRTSDEEGISKQDLTEKVQKATGVTSSGRIPLPTIYLSTSRLFPFGEAGSDESNQINVANRTHLLETSILVKKYKDMYNSVLPRAIDTNTNNFVETKKPKIESSNFYVPLDSAEILTQSVGQDSLSGIINALLAFYNISKKPDYEGGILCIDELDISLHPDAQKKLLKLLKTEAELLNLQIIFTSHSLTLIKEMLKLQTKDQEKYQVLYFRNNKRPLLRDGDTYTSIKADLFANVTYQNPKVKVYLEDEEAVFLLEQVFDIYLEENSNISNILSSCELIASQIGCDTLLKLPEKDSYFQSVILVLDGDARYNNQPKLKDYITTEPQGLNPKLITLKNITFLPGDFSPESLLFKILYKLTTEELEHEDFWNFVENNVYTGNYYPDVLLHELEDMKTKNQLNRDQLKLWFNTHKSFFKQSGILRYYFKEMANSDAIDEFCFDFIKKVEKNIAQLKSKGF